MRYDSRVPTEAIMLIRGQVERLRKEFGIRSLIVFGSVARRQESPSSDVDLLVEFENGTTFDRYFGLKEALEEILGRPVDLATKPMLKPPLIAVIRSEGIRVA